MQIENCINNLCIWVLFQKHLAMLPGHRQVAGTQEGAEIAAGVWWPNRSGMLPLAHFFETFVGNKQTKQNATQSKLVITCNISMSMCICV